MKVLARSIGRRWAKGRGWQLIAALGVLGCSSGATPEPRPRGSRAVAGAAPRESPAPGRNDAAPPACEGPAPARFACAHLSLCAEVDRDDDAIDLIEFLCAAQTVEHSRDDDRARPGPVLASLPMSFRKNFTAKHGIAQVGARGHAYEEITDIVDPAIAARGQSADPEFPRVVMWDETTGFTISVNGGAPGQTGGDRLDLMRYDMETEAFDLWALDMPLSRPLAPFQPHEPTDDCALCHGPLGRPIWPMYPDWPGFFGSDNDELTGDTDAQRMEAALLGHFRGCIAAPPPTGPPPTCSAPPLALRGSPRAAARAGDTRRRYATLFAEVLAEQLRASLPSVGGDAIAAWAAANPRRLAAASRRLDLADPEALRDFLGLRLHPTFPYRPDHRHESGEPSRAFFHRPNLRLGVLYNRLIVRSVFARLRADSVYREHAALVVLSLMDCGWEGPREPLEAAVTRFAAATRTRPTAVDHRVDPTRRLLYPALLAGLGLQLRDVDLRFSHPNPRFDQFDRPYVEPSLADHVMDLGYIAYRERDYNAVNGSAAYFNAYFDGSATFDELLVSKLLEELARDEPAVAAAYEPHSLRRKYERFTARWALDEVFFTRMDALGSWVPLPYPRHLGPLHDREPFGKIVDGRAIFIEPYKASCKALQGLVMRSVSG